MDLNKVIVMIIDVGVSPWEELSNFTAYKFSFRGFKCESPEGLLQSLKMHLSDKQKRTMALTGLKAKRKGKKKQWHLDHILYWQGQPIDRFSDYYQLFIDEIFLSLFEQNEVFREKLLSTGDTKLVHSHGKQDPRFTILTEHEFVSRLTRLREGTLSKSTFTYPQKILLSDRENKLIHKIFHLADNENMSTKDIHRETNVSIEVLKRLINTHEHWAWRGIEGNLLQQENQKDEDFHKTVKYYTEMLPELRQGIGRMHREKKQNTTKGQ